MNRLIGSMIACSLLPASVFAEASPAWKFSLRNGADCLEILSTAAGDGILLASTRTHGVYLSSDTGRTWRPDAAGALRLYQLEFDSATHLFYGLGDSTLYSRAPQAPAWTQVTTFGDDPLSPIDPAFPGMHPSSDLSVHGRLIILLRAQSSGVMVSRDGGRNWRRATYPTVGLGILSVLAADSCVYASDMDSPVSVSCDGGATWRLAGGDSVSQYGYGLARHRGAVLVASGYGVYRSENRGRTWTSWNRNLQEDVEPGNSRIVGLKTRGNSLYAYKWVFAGSPSQQTLHRSTDGGSSWTAIAALEDGEFEKGKNSLTWMEAAEAGNHLFLPSWRGLLHSDDGGTAWSRLRVLGDRPVLSLSVRGSRILALTGAGLFLSTDSGTTWNTALRTDSTSTGTTLSGSSRLYALLDRQGGLRVSEDSGATWKPIPVPSPGPALQAAAIGGDLYVLSAGALWRSRGDGTAWSRISLPAEDTLVLMAGGDRSLLLCARSHVWEYLEDGGFRDRSAALPSFDIPRAWLAGAGAYVISNGELYGWEASGTGWRRRAPHLRGRRPDLEGNPSAAQVVGLAAFRLRPGRQPGLCRG